jgi:hypothetical protein
MNRQLEQGFDKVVGYIGMLVICAICTVYLTGCAGVELGGKFGLYRVDERADNSATVQAQTKPFKCYWVNCSEEKGS